MEFNSLSPFFKINPCLFSSIIKLILPLDSSFIHSQIDFYKYIITIIFLEFICCVCKNLFGNDLSHESSEEFYCLMLIIFLFGIIMNNIQFHSFKWLRIALNKLFSIKIEKVRVLAKYLDTIFKTIIGYQSTSVIVYEAFHSEQLNATLTTLVEKLFTTFFLYIALVFFSWQ